jgi:hypothetical protein
LGFNVQYEEFVERLTSSTIYNSLDQSSQFCVTEWLCSEEAIRLFKLGNSRILYSSLAEAFNSSTARASLIRIAGLDGALTQCTLSLERRKKATLN